MDARCIPARHPLRTRARRIVQRDVADRGKSNLFRIGWIAVTMEASLYSRQIAPRLSIFR